MRKIFTCNACNDDYIRSMNSNLEPYKCDRCIFNEAWTKFITEIAKSLRLDRVLEWLSKKIK
jgi:transposase-like protein